jgi:hypothetical protein
MVVLAMEAKGFGILTCWGQAENDFFEKTSPLSHLLKQIRIFIAENVREPGVRVHGETNRCPSLQVSYGHFHFAPGCGRRSPLLRCGRAPLCYGAIGFREAGIAVINKSSAGCGFVRLSRRGDHGRPLHRHTTVGRDKGPRIKGRRG